MNVVLVLSIASAATSLLTLAITIGTSLRVGNVESSAGDVVEMIGADIGNHEARLEILEQDAGVESTPSDTYQTYVGWRNNDAAYEEAWREAMLGDHEEDVR